jgi:hypothetical protein
MQVLGYVMKYAGEVARFVQKRNTCRVLVGEAEGKAADKGILLK